MKTRQGIRHYLKCFSSLDPFHPSQSSLFRNFKFPVRFSGSSQPPFRLDSTIASTQTSEEDATVLVSSSSSFHVAYFIHSIQVWGGRGERQSKQRRAERGGSEKKNFLFLLLPPSPETKFSFLKVFIVCCLLRHQADSCAPDRKGPIFKKQGEILARVLQKYHARW